MEEGSKGGNTKADREWPRVPRCETAAKKEVASAGAQTRQAEQSREARQGQQSPCVVAGNVSLPGKSRLLMRCKGNSSGHVKALSERRAARKSAVRG